MHKTNNEGTNLGIWQIPMRHTLTKKPSTFSYDENDEGEEM